MIVWLAAFGKLVLNKFRTKATPDLLVRKNIYRL
jgi:hypothetical protein